MLIGDKNYFAIEFELININKSIGKFFLWISNKRLGKDEETYIFPNLKALYLIRDLSKNESINIFNHNKECILKCLFDENSDLYDMTLIGLSETFDYLDFYRFYFYNEFLIFVWGTEEDTYLEKVEKNYFYSVIYNFQSTFYMYNNPPRSA